MKPSLYGHEADAEYLRGKLEQAQRQATNAERALGEIADRAQGVPLLVPIWNIAVNALAANRLGGDVVGACPYSGAGDTEKLLLGCCDAGTERKKMSKRKCALCGRDPAAGFASVNDKFYCHGDDDPEPTCYMRASWALAPSSLNPVVVAVREGDE